MHTTPQLIELAKQRLALKHGLPLPMTDYRLAKLMGLSPQNLTSWKTGRTRIGTQFARKFADACALSAEYVYACVQRERTDNPDEISLLERIAHAFTGKAAALAMMSIGAALLAAGLFLAGPENAVFAAFFGAPMNIHYAYLLIAGAALLLLPPPRWRRFLCVFPVATFATSP